MITDLEEFKREAISYLERYARGNYKFLIEEAREWAYSNGLDRPRDNSWWGGVTRLGIKNNYIEKTTEIQKSGRKTGTTWHPVWRSRILSRASALV
jgi:hypothetical protein